MKPHTHIQHFDRILKKFATYLGSQYIKYRLYNDYDGQLIKPVNSKFYFHSHEGKLCRVERSLNTKMIPHHVIFDMMPMREDIIQ